MRCETAGESLDVPARKGGCLRRDPGRGDTRCVVHPATCRMRQLMDPDQGRDEALYIRVQMNVLETRQ